MRHLLRLSRVAFASLILSTLPAAAQTVSYLYTNNNSSPNTVSAFAVQANGDLVTVPGSPFAAGGNNGFCTSMDTITVDRARRRLYSTNGTSNNVAGFDIQPNGALTPVAGSPFAAGPNPTGAVFDPQGRFVIVSNVGGSVWVYAIGAAGQLTKASEVSVGSPHSMEVHPSGNFLYVTTFNNTLHAFSISAAGALTPIAGSPYTGLSNPHGSDITSDGRFLYVANANNASVAAFSINQTTGVPTAVPGSPFPGSFTGIALNPANTLLFTYTISGGQLRSYSVNAGTGALTSVGAFNNSSGTFDPWAQVVSADGQRLYVLNGSPNVSAFDIAPNGSLTSHPGSPYSRAVSGCSGGIALFTPLASAQPGQVLISEFRLRGQNGPLDEFIELYNNTDSPITVASGDGSAGWTLRSSDGSLNLVIPNGDTIPARGHYLLTNGGAYSLATYPGSTHGVGGSAHNRFYTSGDVPTHRGLALFRTATAANFTLANRLDAAGPNTEANDLYREGAGYTPVNDIDFNYSLLRDLAANRPKDTQDNGADFRVVAVGTNTVRADSVYGYPSPENTGSPVERNMKMPMTMLDPAQSASAAPNRVRDASATGNPCSTLGTLSMRRTVTNNTGAPVTRLRFRIIDITTAPAPTGVADLRPITSGDVSVMVGGVTRTVRGLTLEAAGAPPNNCGGLNSSLSLGNVTPTAPDAVTADGGSSEVSAEAGDGEWNTVELNAPLNAGQSMDVHFLFGVQQSGSFRVFVNIEVLP